MDVLGLDNLGLVELLGAGGLGRSDKWLFRRQLRYERRGLDALGVVGRVHLDRGLCSGALVLLQRVRVALVVLWSRLLLRSCLLWRSLGTSSSGRSELYRSRCVERLIRSRVRRLLGRSSLRNACENARLVEVGSFF